MQVDDLPKSEDCLTLNVWRPAKESSQPLPVMVWIFGGALAHGNTAMYDGSGLAKQGVMVVSMNYRVSRLGFFAHPALAKEAPEEVHANYGHLDQLEALRWNRVTVFGESAGGGSVLVHLTSELSRGLYRNAILQSPGVPAPRAASLPLAELADAEKLGLDYARSLGIDGDGPEALAQLRALPAEELVKDTKASDVIAVWSAGKQVPGFAGAIRDGRLIAEAPETVLREGRQARVPILVGANDKDLGVGSADSKDVLFARFGSLANQARAAYDPLGDQALGELVLDVLGDQTLIEPARFMADAVARTQVPVYLYRFSYVAESQRGTQNGTLHAFEIPYTMNIPAALTGDKTTPDDRAMGALASAYWVDFAKAGNPNGAGRVDWPRHRAGVERVMHFTNDGAVVGTDPFQKRLDLVERAR
jgi:para-nitrobenzyl esterase